MTRTADEVSPTAEERAAPVPGGGIVTATAVTMASVGGVIAWLAPAQGRMMDLAVIAVAGGWIWVGWQSLRYKARPATSTLGAMGAASFLLALAAFWQMIEPIVVELLIS